MFFAERKEHLYEVLYVRDGSVHRQLAHFVAPRAAGSLTLVRTWLSMRNTLDRSDTEGTMESIDFSV